MSKSRVNKFLRNLSREQLVEQLLDSYGSCKEIKRYLDFIVNPDLDRLVRDTQKQIYACFFNHSSCREVRKPRIAKVNAIMRDFNMLVPDAVPQIDMTVFIINTMIRRTEFSYVESFVKSMVAQFRRLSNLIVSAGLEADYREKMFGLIDKTKSIGWSCTDRVCDAIDPAFLNTQYD